MTAYPLLPVRDVVLFPGMRLPLYVARPLSLGAIDHTVAHDLPLLVVTQRQGATEQPKACDLYGVGTLAKVLNRTILDDGSVKIDVLGHERAQLLGLDERTGCLEARAVILPEPEGDGLQAALQSLAQVFARVITPHTKAERSRTDAIMATMQDALEGTAATRTERIERLHIALAAIAI